MITPRFRPLRLATAVVLSFCPCSCEDTQASVDRSCDSIRDCPLDEYCDVPSRRCVQESALTNAAVGRFRCIIANSGDTQGDSDIVLRADRDGDGSVTFAERWTFPAIGICRLDEDGQLIVGAKAWGESAGLWLSIDARLALTSGAPLGTAKLAFSPDSAMLYDYEADLSWAYAVSGNVGLSGVLELGEQIEGYLEAKMKPVKRYSDQVVYGVPCPEGLVDCGAEQEVACTQFDTAALCTGTCGSNVECERGGAICIKAAAAETGMCLRACSSNADCAAPLRCSSLEGFNVCA